MDAKFYKKKVVFEVANQKFNLKGTACLEQGFLQSKLKKKVIKLKKEINKFYRRKKKKLFEFIKKYLNLKLIVKKKKKNNN
jgi:hypothetical protein